MSVVAADAMGGVAQSDNAGHETGTSKLDAWRDENAAWLAARLRLLRLRLHRLVVESREQGVPVVAGWLVAGDDAESLAPEVAGAVQGSRLAALDAQIAEAAKSTAERGMALAAASRAPALMAVAELAGLSALDEEVLLLAAASSLDGAFAAAFAEVHGDDRRDHPTLHLALSLYASGSDRILAMDVLLPSQPLRLFRLIQLGRDGTEPGLLRPLTVDERVADYLRGVNRIDARLVPYLVAVPPSTRTTSGGVLTDAIVRVVEAEPNRWPTVNVVGGLDSGATASVARACQELGLRLCSLDQERLASLDPDDRVTTIELIGREAVLADIAVMVDARRMDRASPAASAVDELVRTVNAPLFLLSTDRWPATETALDVLPVHRPSRVEQQAMWHEALAPHPNTVDGEIDAIVQQFDFGPLAIGEVVGRAARDAETAISGRDLWDACRAQAGSGLEDLARRIIPAWDWGDIVVATDVEAQLHELADQVAHRPLVYETWGFAAQLGRGRGITALFAGPSGTGKTMAAEIIAGHLRLDLYRIDLAGVVSKYVGETEKNLRRVFDAAESSGAILLFDEADALFGTRTEVRDSHDRYANLEINYLLQAMEDYRGLAILATNRRAALDGAFLRRLRFIVEFPFPDADARRQIWERIFPSAAELDGIDHSFLAGLELAGGSIRSIAVNAAFLAAVDGGPIRMPHLVRAAAREYAKLARPVGAAEFGDWLTVARR